MPKKERKEKKKQNKKIEIFENHCMMMWNFIPCHINLGLHISMS
jgi:hypothetical protein